MSLTTRPFELIKYGMKNIEVRLFDEKRQKVNLGDTIIFSKLPNKEEQVFTKVLGLSRFPSIRELYDNFPNSKFGNPGTITTEEQVKKDREFYSLEQEKQFGVLAIHIQLFEPKP
jgi:ASC-1-like (ASCH) protein